MARCLFTNLKTKSSNGNGLAELSGAIGFARKTIWSWKKKYADCPKTYDINDWLEWLEQHKEVGLPGAKPNVTREELLSANLEKRNTLLDVDIEEARGRLIETSKVSELLSRYLVQAKQSLYKRFCNELPGELAGKDEMACQKKLSAAVARHLADIQKAFAKVTTDAKTKRARSIPVQA